MENDMYGKKVFTFSKCLKCFRLLRIYIHFQKLLFFCYVKWSIKNAKIFLIQSTMIASFKFS
jgi:hypothetical protein